MAVHGHSTTLAGSSAGTIGEVRKLDVSGRKRDSIDVSSCDSTSSAREFIPGMMDEGEITVEVVYDGSNTGVAYALDGAFTGKTAETWTITWPDTSSHSGSGFITNLSTATAFESEITQSITIKCSGVWTYSDVSA
jgi:predicted secreted protein